MGDHKKQHNGPKRPMAYIAALSHACSMLQRSNNPVKYQNLEKETLNKRVPNKINPRSTPKNTDAFGVGKQALQHHKQYGSTHNY